MDICNAELDLGANGMGANADTVVVATAAMIADENFILLCIIFILKNINLLKLKKYDIVSCRRKHALGLDR
jgi:hypothetical protein